MPAGLEGATYALAIVLIFWPGLVRARYEIIGAGDDARYYTWLGWRMGRLIAHGILVPLRVPDVIAPFGFDLRLIDGYLPSYVSALFNLVVGPILAYNLTFLTGAVLNVACARSLARRLSPLRPVYVIAAIAFLGAPPIALNVQLGLLPLFWAFTAPLLVGDAIDVVRGVHEVRPVRLTCILTVAYLCSVYFLVFGGLAYGIIVGVAALRRRSWRIPITAAAALACALVLLLPFVVLRLRFDRAEARRGADTVLLSDSRIFSADALSIVAQPTRSTFLFPRPSVIDRSILRLPDPRCALEGTIFPGWLLLAGFTIFLLSRDACRLPLTAAAVTMWVLSLGPSLKVGGKFLWTHSGEPVSWLPYRLLLAVPALGALRVPIRTGSVFTTVLVAGAAIALHRIGASRTRWAPGLALGSAALLATNLLIPLATTTMGTTAASEGGMREIARLAEPGDTVLRVPSDCDPSFASYQILHHTPVVGCTGSLAANPWSKLVAYAQSEALMKLRCDLHKYGLILTSGHTGAPFGPADLDALRAQFGVRFVIVDHALLGACPAVSATLPVIERYRSLGWDGRFDVLDLSTSVGG